MNYNTKKNDVLKYEYDVEASLLDMNCADEIKRINNLRKIPPK